MISLGLERRLGVVELLVFFFQAEDGIRDLVRSRGLGDVYKRQALAQAKDARLHILDLMQESAAGPREEMSAYAPRLLSLIHI